jgi:hypothetical protein
MASGSAGRPDAMLSKGVRSGTGGGDAGRDDLPRAVSTSRETDGRRIALAHHCRCRADRITECDASAGAYAA